MDADERALLEKTIADVVASADGEALSSALDDLGWLELLAADPAVGVPAVFGALGRATAWSSALHDVLGSQLGQLPVEMSPATTSVVAPRPRSSLPGRADRDGIIVEGLLVGARTQTKWFVAATADGDGGVSVSRIPRRAATIVQRAGLDRGIDVQSVTWAGDEAEIVADGENARSWWETSVALARRALTHQLCETLEGMLALARGHAVDRHQFGRPIGSFQAVRHKLAESTVAIAGALAVADAVWESDDDPLASATAKLVASRACSTVTTHTQQILAGIGFTAEHPYHHAMKRALVLDRLFGDAHDLAPLVGRELVARGTAPRLVEL